MARSPTGAKAPKPTALPDLVHAFSALQLLMVTAPGVEDFLSELSGLAARIVEPVGSCGITLRRDSSHLTIASSDELAEAVDQAQYAAGTGPCLDSLVSAAIVDVPDLGAETRWPGFRPRALELGVRSCLAVPLTDGTEVLGALNLYGRRPRVFDTAAQEKARTFATQAATALRVVLRTTVHAEQSAQLERALASRTEIDQALGILMGQQRCTADEAFALLRRHSQNNNRKLRDVAVDLITRVTGQPPVSGSVFDR